MNSSRSRNYAIMMFSLTIARLLCSSGGGWPYPITNRARELFIPASVHYPADYFSGAQINSQAFPDSNLILTFDAS